MFPFGHLLCAAQKPTSDFDDLATRAAQAREQQNLPLAIQLYTQADLLNPEWQQGWWYLGVLEYGSNQFSNAIEAFTHLLQLVPTAAPALALRGLCEFETGDYESSLRDLEVATSHGAAKDPHNEQIIRSHLAQLLVRAGRFQDALEQYRFFAQNNLDSPDLMIGIGLAGMRIPALPKEVAPQNRETYEAAGSAAYVFLNGDSDRADELFGQLFARYPSTTDLHFLYGILLLGPHPELSTEQFRRELVLNPKNESARALFAFTLVLEGKYEEALEPARSAYQAAPDLELAQIAFGRALAETGDTQQATALLRQVIMRDPGNVEAHLGLVSLYSHSGDREGLANERELCRSLAK